MAQTPTWVEGAWDDEQRNRLVILIYVYLYLLYANRQVRTIKTKKKIQQGVTVKCTKTV